MVNIKQEPVEELLPPSEELSMKKKLSLHLVPLIKREPKIEELAIKIKAEDVKEEMDGCIKSEEYDFEYYEHNFEEEEKIFEDIKASAGIKGNFTPGSPDCITKQNDNENRIIEATHHISISGKNKIHKSTFKCIVCLKKFTSMTSLSIHKKIHFETYYRYKCSFCNKRFLTKEELEVHAKNHSEKGPLKCRECGKGFYNKEDLLSHVRDHKRNEGKRKCDDCGKVYSRRCHLRMHMRSHSGERPYVCTHCGKSFARIDNLKIHWRLHTEIRPYTCNICSKSFTQQAHLRTHQKNVHIQENIFSCDDCGKHFLSKDSVRHHLITHLNELKYKCCECNKLFRRFSEVKSHVVIHDANRPLFKCCYCEKTVKSKLAMKRHVNVVHFNIVRKYQCEYCNISVVSEKSLHRHLKLHNDESVVCNDCGMRFTSKTNLLYHIFTNHMNTQNITGKFACIQCKRLYSRKASLLKHVKRCKKLHL